MRVLLSLLLLAPLLMADEEASNTPHVAASKYGRCYAKSIPSASYGNAGNTLVYRVTEGDDQLIHEYDRYSQRIFLACNASDGAGPVGAAIVSTGPWARGHAASAEHLALAFSYKGKKVAEYSTLDIAERAGDVSASVSHYTVIEEYLGFRWIRGNEYAFEVLTTDGRKLAFDAATGARLHQAE